MSLSSPLPLSFFPLNLFLASFIELTDAVIDRLPPLLYSSFSTIWVFDISVFISSFFIVSPFEVILPFTFILLGSKPIPLFVFVTLFCVSPIVPSTPKSPVTPPENVNWAPPCVSDVTISFIFIFPPTSKLPDPVLDPKTAPVRSTSFPTDAFKAPPAVIPDWDTFSPFFQISPPPALKPSSPFPTVLLAAPTDTFPPAFAFMLCSSSFDTRLSTFKFPFISRLTSFSAFTTPPIIFVSPPVVIFKFPLASIDEFVYFSEDLDVISKFALPPTPISVFAPHSALYPALCSSWASNDIFIPFSLDVSFAAFIFKSFLASKAISFLALISTPFKSILPLLAFIVTLFPSIVVIFSFVDDDWLFSTVKFTDCFENTPARSLKIRFVAAPIPWAAKSPTFSFPFFKALSISIPLLIVSAIALLTPWDCFTLISNPVLSVFFSSSYLVDLTSEPSIVTSPLAL